MFRIYHSNALDLLKDLLVELIRREPLDDPFAQETILVQSPGMAQWLKLELAESLGIAAAVRFPLPASFLWESFAAVLDGVPERSAYDKEAMTWKLMYLLPELLAQEAFAPLRHYLEDDRAEFKRYQLCGKIADLLDQYLVYRPDWILDWEQGGQLGAATQPWQPLLWRRLVAQTEALGQPHWHRANMYSRFVAALTERRGSEDGLPPRLFVFGISALPQKFVEALQAMGRTIDVHLLVTNPCRYYWGEILDQAQIARLNRRWFDKPDAGQQNHFEHGNPLLASMGKLGRDYLHLLQDLGAEEIELFEAPTGATLLHRLQRDILQLDDASAFPQTPGAHRSSEHKTLLASDDRSLQLHSCHSPLREVEVLHDQLLALFEQAAAPTPRDIIVMMPDVAAYAPYIEAVFGNAAAERYIPYSISDRSVQQENPLLLSFLRLTALQQSRFTVSEMLELLEVPAILRRLELDEAGYHRLRQWIDGVNIRWGLDSQQRALLELPLFEQNSWRFGLRRMLAGYALGALDGLWADIAPYGEIEGIEAALLGKLVDFIDLLEHCSHGFSGARPLPAWIEAVNDLLGRAYLADEQDEIALAQIRSLLERLVTQTGAAAFTQPLSAEILHDYLRTGLTAQRASQRFMVGAVNFCTLMPMRSIPFRVVCLLGMNDGDYPRSLPPLGFDLMAEQPRRGDRSRRDDDRYLFLEALLSARERLYISYVGRSIQDNREKVPSVLVSELLEYCGLGYVFPEHRQQDTLKSRDSLRAQLTQEHPLAPFSHRYFHGEGGLFSYAREWLPAAAARLGPQPGFLSRPLPAEPLQQLELDELLRFFRNPCRYFLNRRLKVFYAGEEPVALDEEPFDLERLDDYLLKGRYLTAALAGESLAPVDARVMAEGLLPVGTGGRQLLGKIRQDCEALAGKLRSLMAGEAQRRELRLQLGGVELSAWLDGFYGGRLLRYRPSKVQGHDRLQSWIEHLAASAAFADLEETCYRGLSGRVSFRPLPPDQARERLTQLLAFYREGQTRPLAFDPACAWAYVISLDGGEEQALMALEKCFNGGPRNRGSVEDPAIRRIYPEFTLFAPEQQALALQVLEPMLPWMEECKDD